MRSTTTALRAIAFSFSLALIAAAPVHARTYGPEDAGRRFSDGSVVKCRKVEVRRNSRDPNRIGGTVAGALIGGLVGTQVGKGNGKKLATVGGAVAGGAVGRHVQGKRQESNGDRVVETRCDRVY